MAGPTTDLAGGRIGGATPTLANLANWPVVGAYNVVAGLGNWRAWLGYAGKDSSGNGYGGVDVIIAGDSISEGFLGANPSYDGWHHLLKLKLQARFNPPDVLGGYGLMNSIHGSGAESFVTTFGTVSVGNQGWQCINSRDAKSTANGSNGVFWTCDGTLNAKFRGGITSVQYLGAQFGGYSSARFDCGTGTPGASMIGAGNISTGTHNQNVGSGYYNGARFGTASTPDVTNFITGFNPAAKNYIQWATPASGNGGVAYDGILAYNGDETCGIRVHDMSHYGTALGNNANGAYGPYMTDYGAGRSSIGTPGTGAQGLGGVGTTWGDSTLSTPAKGCKSAGLYILGVLVNDCGQGSSPATALATYITNLTAVVQYVQALPSKPSVVLFIPPMSQTTALTGRAAGTGTYAEFVAAIYAISVAHNCVVADVWTAWGAQLGSTNWVSSGYASNSDSNAYIHPSAPGQAWIADFVYRILIS